MAMSSLVASDAICEALTEDPHLCTRFSSDQFTKLFTRPFTRALGHSHTLPLLVVIDALDEISTHQDDIIEWVLKAESSLPPNAKILLTSRPEGQIIAKLGDNQAIRHEHVPVQGEDAEQDIRTFIETSIQEIATYFNKSRRNLLPSDWPGQTMIDSLCSQASGLFIWASTAMIFIREQISKRGTQAVHGVFDLLIRQGMKDVNQLYLMVLGHAYSEDEDWTDADYVVFRDTIACCIMIPTAEHIDIGWISTWLDLNDTYDLVNLFARLHSVLLLDRTDAPILTTRPHMHPSFLDFITNPDRCTDSRFHVSRSDASVVVTRHCFRLLNALRPNVLQIPGFGTRKNQDIPDLADRFRNYVSRPLLFACLHWSKKSLMSLEDEKRAGFFEVASNPNGDIEERYEIFLRNSLLPSIEVWSAFHQTNSTCIGLSALLHSVRLDESFSVSDD